VRALTPTEAAERVVPSAAEIRDQLTGFARRLKSSLLSQLNSAKRHLNQVASRRVLTHPLDRVHDRARRVDELAQAMQTAIRRRTRRSREALMAFAARLESLSPLHVLARGYSVTQAASGEVVRDVQQVQVGQAIRTRLAHGEIISRVEDIPLPRE
jgi:exodeoxyribonuclease VII large subunit